MISETAFQQSLCALSCASCTSAHSVWMCPTSWFHFCTTCRSLLLPLAPSIRLSSRGPASGGQQFELIALVLRCVVLVSPALMPHPTDLSFLAVMYKKSAKDCVLFHGPGFALASIVISAVNSFSYSGSFACPCWLGHWYTFMYCSWLAQNCSQGHLMLTVPPFPVASAASLRGCFLPACTFSSRVGEMLTIYEVGIILTRSFV